MRTEAVLLVVAFSAVSAGCATKRYPMATPLSTAEVSLMSCQDLALELVRADQVEKQIAQTGGMDARTVAGFLGDFGIGNAMAKNDARKALSIRRAALHAAHLQKQCAIGSGPAGDPSAESR